MDKSWLVRVTDVRSGDTLHEVLVDSTDWMSALQAGRAQIGMGTGMPAGASCTVDSDGSATVHDPVSRHTYHVSPQRYDDPPPAAPREAPTAAAAPAPKAAAPAPKAAAPDSSTSYVPPPPKKRLSNRTVAYGLQPPSAPAAPAATAQAQKPQTSGDRPAEHPVATAGEAAARSGAPPATPATNAEPTADEPPELELGTGDIELESAGSTDLWTVLRQRDSEPTKENPLCYRERCYLWQGETTEEALRAFLLERHQELEREVAQQSPGKFFNLAAFDHAWNEAPERAALAVLTWKDWRGAPEFALGQVGQVGQVGQPAPATTKSLDEPADRATESTSTMNGEADLVRWSAPPFDPGDEFEDPPTRDQDLRLAHAFEASQDLLFLSTPLEGMEFVVRLLKELVPCESITGLLYDINTDELRMVATAGSKDESKRTRVLGRSVGLMDTVTRRPGVAMAFDKLGEDERFDAATEGHPDIDANNALYCALAHQGRLLGVLQLLNRRRRNQFTPGDAELVSYISKQMAKFVQAARLATQR